MSEQGEVLLLEVPKEAKARKAPWKAWYDTVINMSLKGMEAKDIAHALGKHRTSIERIQKLPEYQERLNKVVEQSRETFVDAKSMLETKKIELMRSMIDLATQNDNKSQKLTATMWCLERFPEFAAKGTSLVQQTNVYQPTKEDIAREENVVGQMRELSKILAKGNPHVTDVIEDAPGDIQQKGEQDADRPKQDATPPGGDIRPSA